MEWTVPLLSGPWPWFVAGPLIGLSVPALLLIGNHSLGVSSTFHQLCAAALPGRRPLAALRSDGRVGRWNLIFALGLLLGGFIAGTLLANPQPVQLSSAAQASVARLGVDVQPGLMPALFSGVTHGRVLLLLALSGGLVGFGARYAGGCTSGHSVSGLATLQWPSLLATLCFVGGGSLSAQLLLPLVLRWTP